MWDWEKEKVNWKTFYCQGEISWLIAKKLKPRSKGCISWSTVDQLLEYMMTRSMGWFGWCMQNWQKTEKERILRVFPTPTTDPTSVQLLAGNSLRRKTWVSYSVPRYWSQDNVFSSTFKYNFKYKYKYKLQ